MTTNSSAPPGQAWYLRDLVSPALLKNFHIDRCTGQALLQISKIKQELYGQGGEKAWLSAVEQARQQLCESLTIAIPEILANAERASGTALSSGKEVHFRQDCDLTFYFQGKPVGTASYQIAAEIAVRARSNGNARVAIKLGLGDLERCYQGIPSLDAWARIAEVP